MIGSEYIQIIIMQLKMSQNRCFHYFLCDSRYEALCIQDILVEDIIYSYKNW